MFLATPHRGTNLASLLNLILTSTIFNNPKDYVNDLKQNSGALQKLNDQFRHIAPRLNIVSFYETQPTPIGLKNTSVVCQHSENIPTQAIYSPVLDDLREGNFDLGISGRNLQSFAC